VTKPLPSQAALEGLIDDVKAFVGRPARGLLVAGGREPDRAKVGELFAGAGVQVTAVASGREAQQLLRERRTDCVVLLPDPDDGAGAEDLAAEARRADPDRAVPVVVYSEGAPPAAEAGVRAADGRVHQVCSPERLLDQVTFHLHTPLAKLPEFRRQALEQLHQTDKVLAGKKVLIVDDDIRNIFALTSVLEWHNMQIVAAETGRDAIARLQDDPDIDIVLMDIMMPEMDGLDTMRAIRQLSQFRSLPIIAVTAKAMKGDREKCIEAGAWDYLSKPVDTEQMLAVMRAWLHR
jgi:CheY-like chemotaxis protein